MNKNDLTKALEKNIELNGKIEGLNDAIANLDEQIMVLGRKADREYALLQLFKAGRITKKNYIKAIENKLTIRQAEKLPS